MSLPTQRQIYGPLLQVLKNGPLRAGDACEAVADVLRLERGARDAIDRLPGGQSVKLFARRVRWTRQNAVLAGLVAADQRGVWRLTESGDKMAFTARAGVVVTVYSSAQGSMLWAEARSAVGYLEDESLASVITSPPYPLVVPRDYDKDWNAWRPENYLETLISHIELLRPKLYRDGSLVLNLGPAFRAGTSARNPYQHQLIQTLVDRLGWHLIDEHFWVNPSKPRAAPQVTKQRTHCVNQVEPIFVLSPSNQTRCSNLRVLNPYTPRHARLIASGGETTGALSPSRMKWPGTRFKADNGGSIPGNVHVIHSDKDLSYRKAIAEVGLGAHPAMMPLKLAEFFVQLTTEPGELVLDPFGGSAKTAEACLRLDRRFVIFERRLDYLRGGVIRLQNAA